MKGKTVPILIIAVIFGAVIVAVIVFATQETDTSVSTVATTNTATTTNTNEANYGGGGPAISFQDCVAYNGTVFESYPRKCTLSDGETFTEDLGNLLDKTDLITLTTPQPNDSLTSPLTITGQARGSWFFEGEFPIFIYDVLDVLIGQTNAVTQGEWMTDEFVNFEATLEFTEPAYGPGLLYLNKSNASDNADLDDALIIPIDFPLQ